MKNSIKKSKVRDRDHQIFEMGIDATWNFKSRSAGTIARHKISWKELGLTPEMTLLLQNIGIQILTQSERLADGCVLSNCTKRISAITKLMLVCREFKPKVLFCHYEKKDWVKALLACLYKTWRGNSKYGRSLIETVHPLSYVNWTIILSELRFWNDLYVHGHVNDGPEYSLDYSDLRKLLQDHFQSYGLRYDKWRNGVSFGSIDFVVANLLLTDAIATLNSAQTKQLLAYFEAARDCGRAKLIVRFWSGNSHPFIEQYRSLGVLSEEEVDSSSTWHDCVIGFLYPLHARLTAYCESSEAVGFPWRTHTELVGAYYKVLSAIYIIFLSVTGKRGPSEILTLRAVDITPASSAPELNATFRPGIFKTNQGLREVQGITNFIDDAFNTLLKLGYVDKANSEFPIFSSLHPKAKSFNAPTQLSGSYAHKSLETYYEDFIRRFSETVDFDIRGIQGSITSHQFRHAFAEFALRRFDGNVEELIRQHFCHQHNHWWTKRYTADKLDWDYQNELSRNYIRELVPRILSDADVDHDFVGGMAIYIKRELGAKVKTLHAVDAEEHILEFCDNIQQINAHEYGWCLVHRKYAKMAKCINKDGDLAPSDTDSSKCNICPNFCASKQSHLAMQTQIAISHLNFIESNVWKMQSLKIASREAVENAVALFPELEELLNGRS